MKPTESDTKIQAGVNTRPIETQRSFWDRVGVEEVGVVLRDCPHCQLTTRAFLSQANPVRRAIVLFVIAVVAIGVAVMGHWVIEAWKQEPDGQSTTVAATEANRAAESSSNWYDGQAKTQTLPTPATETGDEPIHPWSRMALEIERSIREMPDLTRTPAPPSLPLSRERSFFDRYGKYLVLGGLMYLVYGVMVPASRYPRRWRCAVCNSFSKAPLLAKAG